MLNFACVICVDLLSMAQHPVVWENTVPVSKLSHSNCLSILQSVVYPLRQFVNTSSELGRCSHQKLTTAVSIPNSCSTVSIAHQSHDNCCDGGKIEHQSVNEGLEKIVVH